MTSFYENFFILRKAIIYSLSFFIVLVVLVFCLGGNLSHYFASSIEKFIDKKNIQIVYGSLSSPFFIRINFSTLVALFIGLPFFIFQLYKFISPGLYKKEKKTILPYILISPILFLTGSLLAYCLIIPNAVNFFISFVKNDDQVKMLINLADYLSLCIKMIILFGLSFQMPLILQLLVKIEVLSIDSLRKSRRFVIVIVFILAAILTPPDILSQIMLAVPLILLYELVIILNLKRVKKIA